METFELKKLCEVCEKPIPDGYGNLLCDEHYKMASQEKERGEKEAQEARGAALSPEQKEVVKQGIEEVVPFKNPDSFIRDPEYKENPQMDDKQQVMANMAQFVKSGKWLWHPTRNMYEFIKNDLIDRTKAHQQFSKHIWKPHVVDVGCGSGVGTNILSWEADFAWGLDKNKLSIDFANEVLRREKNGIYYSPQLSYEVVDIMEDTREMMQFDIVVAIEIIEHIDDWKGFMKTIIQKFSKKKKDGGYVTEVHHGKEGVFHTGTVFYISTPNRNNPKISDEKPKNKYHVREVTGEEFHDQMSLFFKEVQLMDTKGNSIEPSSTETPIVAKCFNPK